MLKKYFLNVELEHNKYKTQLNIEGDCVYYENINRAGFNVSDNPIFLCYKKDIKKFIKAGIIREEINYGKWANDEDIVDILVWYQLNFNHNNPHGACVVLEKYKEHKGIHQDE